MGPASQKAVPAEFQAPMRPPKIPAPELRGRTSHAGLLRDGPEKLLVSLSPSPERYVCPSQSPSLRLLPSCHRESWVSSSRRLPVRSANKEYSTLVQGP